MPTPLASSPTDTRARAPAAPPQSFTGFMVGDIVAQAPDLAAGKPWDARRTAKMGAFGIALHGPIGHYWYGFLDRTIMTKAPTSAMAVATKTAVDQVVLAPLFTAGFFASMKAMDGKSAEIKEEVTSKLWPTMKVNCAFLSCVCGVSLGGERGMLGGF